MSVNLEDASIIEALDERIVELYPTEDTIMERFREIAKEMNDSITEALAIGLMVGAIAARDEEDEENED